MRILHVISTMDPRAGGPCQGIRNLRPLMTDHGHWVEVVCLDDPEAAYLKEEGLWVHALGRGRGPWAYHPALRPWLEANLHRFDAVILNGLWQYVGFTLARLAKKWGDKIPPYVIFAHGMLDPWFQRAPERRLKAIRNWIYWKLVERHVIARAAALCFTCAEELRLAQTTFRPYQPQRQLNVGYGVDEPPPFHERMRTAFAAQCPELQGRPYLLFLGRIHPKKGVGLLLHAYARLCAEQRAASGEPRAVGRGPAGAPLLAGAPASPPAVGSHHAARTARLPALVIAGPGLETDYGRQMQKLAASIEPGATSGEPGDNQQRTTGSRTSAREDARPTDEQMLKTEGGNLRLEAGNLKPEHEAPPGLRFQVSDFRSQVSGLEFQVSGLLPTAHRSVFFPGMLTGDAKWGAFYGCEAFVLPSHQENFGIAVAEALACGKPVLISNQINIWREIAEDGAGLVEPDTAEGTERLLQRWQALSVDEKSAMTRAARASFENRFGVARAAANLSAALKAITGKE